MKNTNQDNIYTLAEAIDLFLKECKIKNNIDAIRIREIWSNILGKLIDRQTSKIFIKKKILYVALESSALKSELFYAKNKIISRINEELKEELIEDIVFL